MGEMIFSHDATLASTPADDYHPAVRITPNPIARRSRSENFNRAFSASSFVLNGFDKGVRSVPTYLKSSHLSVVFISPL
jgi:hypothetical protein